MHGGFWLGAFQRERTGPTISTAKTPTVDESVARAIG